MGWLKKGVYWQGFFMEDGAPCTVLCDDGKCREGTPAGYLGMAE